MRVQRKLTGGGRADRGGEVVESADRTDVAVRTGIGYMAFWGI